MTTRRLKTYTAQTGYVYSYYFVGKRRALPGESPSAEYIFDVSPDRKMTFAVSVFVLDEAVAGWRNTHGRALNEAEEYAAAKMRLLQSFDEVDDVMGRGRRLTVDLESLEELLSGLGVD